MCTAAMSPNDRPALVADALGPMAPRTYRVISKEIEIADTITLVLEPVAEPISTPAPGQFTMLWAIGVGEAPISLASFGGDPMRRIKPHSLTHTIRKVGAVTSALAKLEAGEIVGVRGPFGTGWNLEAAKGNDVLIIAGGLGVAPVRPIIEEILANRSTYGRVAFLVGARSPQDLLYRQQLDDWVRSSDIHMDMTVDAAGPLWRGNVGLVTQLVDQVPIAMKNAAIFICGPEIMMRFAARFVIDRGATPSRVQVSLERNMHCGIGHCGRCQLGHTFLCKDGPVLTWDVAEPLLEVSAR